MKQDYTHVVMVIDRSGSMSATWNDVKGGYKQIVQDNKKDSGQCTFTVAVFDDKYDILEDFTDISKVSEELATSPRGWTALLDAVGKTINEVGEKLNNLKEDERPHRVLIYIISDGQENSSTEFKKTDIVKMIHEQESKYLWTFNYLGSTIDSVSDAISLGIRDTNSAVFNDKNYGNTFKILSEKIRKTRSVSDADYAATCVWSESERKNLYS